MNNYIQQFSNTFYRLQIAADVPMIVRVLRYRQLRHLYYEQYWKTAANSIGARIAACDGGYFRISRDGQVTLVKQTMVMLDNQLLLNVMGNKKLTNTLMHECGFECIEHEAFSMNTFKKAVSFLERQQGPVVIKPMSGTGGGRGVTTGIYTYADLKRAARLAARFGHNVLVEKQVEGDSYRLLFLGGEFVDAVRRDPPVVVGDGKSTIRNLIKQENKARISAPPFRALSPLVIDTDCKNWISHQHISLSNVPTPGDVVQVKRAVNENDFSGNVNVRSRVNREIMERCQELVKRLGIQFAGVDLICRDISGPYHPENCIIGEVNTTPGPHHHALISNPADAVPVGQIVLEYMFDNDIGVMHLGR